MSQAYCLGVQTANSEVPIRAEYPSQLRNPASRTEQRAAFNIARSNGLTIAKASLSVGVSRRTGGLWEKERIVDSANLNRRKASLATKTELGEVYTSLIRNGEVDARDRVAAGKAYAELAGLNEPTRQEITHMHVAVRDWVLSGAAPMQPAIEQRAIEAGVEPPKQVASEAFSPSKDISQNSTKESK